MDIGFQDRLSLNADQKYCRMLQWEHSAILSTFIKLPFVISITCLCLSLTPPVSGLRCIVFNKVLICSVLFWDRLSFWMKIKIDYMKKKKKIILRSLFRLILSGLLRQVLLYAIVTCSLNFVRINNKQTQQHPLCTDYMTAHRRRYNVSSMHVQHLHDSQA